MLRDAPSNKLPIESIDDIAFSLNISKEKVETVVKNYGLFTVDEMQFFSERLCRSMLQYSETKGKLSEAGKKGMAKRWASNDKKMIM